MTASVLHKMGGLTVPRPIIPAQGYFLARRTATLAAPASTTTDVNMDDIISDDYDFLDGDGVMTVPSAYNGLYIQFHTSLSTDVRQRMAAGIRISTDGGTVWNWLSYNYKDAQVLPISRLTQMVSGYKYRMAIFMSGVSSVVQNDINTYFQGITYKESY